MSDSFVSKWKIIFENEGAGALKVNYKGGMGFLTEEQRDEIIFYLKMQPHYSVEELRDYLERYYGVVYQSIAILLRPSESRRTELASNPSRYPETR